ncbi:MAG TPA: hypothetical protein PKE62_13355 [Anaerolineales bacterium]|nr:hypothetical protein [Anaerolineales bacterium]
MSPLPEGVESPPVTATQPPATTEASLPVTDDYAVFSINVQDFSHPAESAAVLNRILDLHEELNVPVDVYLTDVMARIYAEQYPDLLTRLKTSPVVAVSYHYRAPRPYANNYDWLGLGAMNADELYQTVMRYETHAVDPVTGQTTDDAGGYQYVADAIGYAPYTASSIADSAEIDSALLQTFRELGAQMTVVHGRALNLGDMKKGLPIRPEHYDYKLFEYTGDAMTGFESALTQAHQSGGVAPYFVGVKMHDNDFFATRSAWLTVYVDGGKRPNWDPSLAAPLLTQAEQDAMWALYEQTVRYVASQTSRVTPVNIPMVLEMLK